MISEIDIKDWERIDTESARANLEAITSEPTYANAYCFNRLEQFIRNVELVRRKYIPQVAALFKEKNEQVCRED